MRRKGMEDPDFRVRLLQWIVNLVCEKMPNTVVDETHGELGFQRPAIRRLIKSKIFMYMTQYVFVRCNARSTHPQASNTVQQSVACDICVAWWKSQQWTLPQVSFGWNETTVG